MTRFEDFISRLQGESESPLNLQQPCCWERYSQAYIIVQSRTLSHPPTFLLVWACPFPLFVSILRHLLVWCKILYSGRCQHSNKAASASNFTSEEADFSKRTVFFTETKGIATKNLVILISKWLRTKTYIRIHTIANKSTNVKSIFFAHYLSQFRHVSPFYLSSGSFWSSVKPVSNIDGLLSTLKFVHKRFVDIIKFVCVCVLCRLYWCSVAPWSWSI